MIPKSPLFLFLLFNVISYVSSNQLDGFQPDASKLIRNNSNFLREEHTNNPEGDIYSSRLIGNNSDDQTRANQQDYCPANRLEAAEIGRQCSRRCKPDVPCENVRKQCLCDGLCGLSCIKPDLVCPDLPKIEHGSFSPTTTVFDTIVSYQCDLGYFLYGSRERVCQGDEEWSGIPAVCMRDPLCLTPIMINHARNPNDGVYRLNEKVEYSCYPGYQPKGNPEATCKLVEGNQTEWSWEGLKFKCLPKTCGDPGMIENGKRSGDSFIVASSVNYTCNPGYEMVGQSRRFCQSDSRWSGQSPRCEPVTCKPMDRLNNGKINYVYPLVYDSIVEYSCDYGFKLVGPSRRRCGPEGILEGESPICVEIDCGQLWPLDNGYIRGYSSKIGSRLEFRCMEGMDFIGQSRTSVCLESGYWSHPLPNCMAPCIVPPVDRSIEIYASTPSTLIDDLDVTKNLTGLVKITPGNSVKHGVTLEIVCEANYELDEQMNLDNQIQAPICLNGTWSYIPRCKPAACSEVPRGFKNGRIMILSVDHGSKGYLRCLDGYKLVGSNEIQCKDGSWSKTNSTCVEIYCGYPGSMEHGRVMLLGLTGMYDYKPYIRRIPNNRQISYECESGYRLNDGAPSGATCINGQWKPEGLPNCIKE